MRLIEQSTGRGHLRVFEHPVPAGLLLLEPVSHVLAIGRSCRGGDVIGKVAEPLTQRKHPQTLALARPVQQRMELGA